MLHAHTRDPMLAALPKETLDALARAYDEVLTRYAVQDAPQSQIESNSAIAALPVKPEAMVSGSHVSNVSAYDRP